MDDLRALYRKWLPELWNADPHEMAPRAAEIFSTDAVGHWPHHDVHGAEGIAAAVREATSLFDDVTVELVQGPIVDTAGVDRAGVDRAGVDRAGIDTAADGAELAARWRFIGTYRGGIPGAIADPGTRVDYPGADFFRVRDGLLAEYWPLGDNLTLLQQLGALGGTGDHSS